MLNINYHLNPIISVTGILIVGSHDYPHMASISARITDKLPVGGDNHVIVTSLNPSHADEHQVPVATELYPTWGSGCLQFQTGHNES